MWAMRIAVRRGPRRPERLVAVQPARALTAPPAASAPNVLSAPRRLTSVFIPRDPPKFASLGWPHPETEIAFVSPIFCDSCVNRRCGIGEVLVKSATPAEVLTAAAAREYVYRTP